MEDVYTSIENRCDSIEDIYDSTEDEYVALNNFIEKNKCRSSKELKESMLLLLNSNEYKKDIFTPNIMNIVHNQEFSLKQKRIICCHAFCHNWSIENNNYIIPETSTVIDEEDSCFFLSKKDIEPQPGRQIQKNNLLDKLKTILLKRWR